ncbi:MAG: hydroxymethylbilane synthase [Verrucomicrobiota bacterium]
MNNEIVLGTRASLLALAQTELVRRALDKKFPDRAIRVETFVTRGDRKLDLDLKAEPAGGKGLFTRELERALMDGRIDVAVHSLKDLPGNEPEGLEIAAVLPRAATDDVLISKVRGGLAGLPEGAMVGTSSVRRIRQVQHARGDLRVTDWRGNVQTRLRKLRESTDCSAIVLARAGLDRLGMDFANGVLRVEEEGVVGEFFVSSLSDTMLPAMGQGIVALQIRRDDVVHRGVVEAIGDGLTMRQARAERGLQRRLGGDCTLPVGVRTWFLEGGGIRMEGVLFSAEGAEPVRAMGEGADEEEVAELLYRRLTGVGAVESH